MDRLFQRYGDPFTFINGMIVARRFESFVIDFMLAIQKEEEDKFEWEFFLHKVYDCSFEEFKARIKTDKANMQMSEMAKQEAINNSVDILNNFNPERGDQK